MESNDQVNRSAWLALVVAIPGCMFSAPLAGEDPSVDDDEAVADPGDEHDATGSDDDEDGDMPDASPPPCPASYTVTIAGSTSRYRVVANAAVFAAHHADCRDDAVGATHLVALDSPAELAELFAHAQGASPQPAFGAFYVGAVQQPGELGIGDGWLIFTGTPLPAGLWALGQPNDGDAWESFDEQRALVDASGALHDVSGIGAYGAICECDGRPISAVVTAALQF